MISLDSLTRPVTSEEFRASMYRALGIVGVSTTIWKPTATIRTVLSVTSWTQAGVSQLIASLATGGYLELAADPWLRLLARYVFKVEANDATFAQGEWTAVNSGGGIYNDLEPGDIIVYSSSTGKQYRNTETVSIPALSTVTFAIEAVEVGSGSSAVPGGIDSMETILTGVSGSNDLALVGEDEESRESLIQKCLDKLGNLSPNGPKDAFAYAARVARRTDGSLVGATRIKTIKDGYGSVRVICAGPTGPISGDAEDPDTDLGAIQTAIETDAETLNDIGEAEAAESVGFDISYQVWARPSTLTEALFLEKISLNLAKYFSTAPIGGYVVPGDDGKIFHNAIESVIRTSHTEIFRVVVSSPSADTVMPGNGLPVLSSVTGAVNFVEGSQ